MSATVLSLAAEAESRHWDCVVESDRLMALEFVRRAQSLRAVAAAGRAAGRREFVPCEVAAALCVDERSAQAMLAEAELLHELPAIPEAIEDGLLRLPHAKVLVTELLSVETHVALEVVAAVLAKVEGRTPSQFQSVVRRAILRIDSDAAARRRRDELKDRRVFVKPEPHGMALFGAYLAADDAMAAQRIVDARAASYEPDDRCADERRADALMEILRGSSGGAMAPTRRNVDVVVPVTTALGWADEPADLCGYGPVDAEHGRELVTDAILRKVCVDATTGQVLAVGSRTRPVSGPTELRDALVDMVLTPTPYDDEPVEGYRPTVDQRRTAERRDRTCTFPSCSVPAHRCDQDHNVPWPRGSTSLHNLGSKSRRHHRAKQAGWSPSPLPDGSIQWRSPCGRMYTRPPVHDPPAPIDPDAPVPPL
jgi:hypothetical protein